MKNLRFPIFIICYLLLSQSCTRIVYVPNMQNVPLLQEKNEVRATLGVSNFQGAYAVTNNIGVMINGQFRNGGGGPESSFQWFQELAKTKSIEGGVGYFKPFNGIGVFEIYGGGGIGSISFDEYENYLDKYSAATSRFFIQPSVGISNKYLDIAFSLRFVSLKFYNADTSEYVYGSSSFNNEENVDLNELDKHDYTFIEPALTCRFGWKYVKFHLQAVFPNQLNNAPINYNKSSLFAGVHFNIAQRNKE
jgi:hypothetical protein